MFDTCEEKYEQLTCKIRRYVEEGVTPYVPHEENTLLESPVPDQPPRNPRRRLASLMFLLDIFTLGLLHYNYR